MNKKADVIRLDRSYVKDVGRLCASAFLNDPEAVHLMPDETERKRLLPHLFEFAVSYGLLYGEGYAIVAQETEGIALWMSSEGANVTPLKLLRAGFLSLYRKVGPRIISGLMSFVGHSRSVTKDHVSDRHWQLFLLAVNPAHHRKGHASVLLKAMLSRLDNEKVPCFLTTHNERNVAIYERFGFRLVHTGPVSRTDVNLWAMLRAHSA